MSQPDKCDCQKLVIALLDRADSLHREEIMFLEMGHASAYSKLHDLQSEVERLTKERDHYQWASTNDGIACNERARENQDLENQIDALKAENERLRRAGDAMYQSLYRVAIDNNKMLPKSCDLWSETKATKS